MNLGFTYLKDFGELGRGCGQEKPVYPQPTAQGLFSVPTYFCVFLQCYLKWSLA